ncbi:MFS transporter [Futiania mangrovi]|uniref:MFS transporter n=1 Tax=Futiania mangrovi TaxID=2959716 RepID=A0A9J6PFP0_9PROT|nr:MFS transporter [Futiania mangrovii]MCP1337537.1 MFS transporter [Futiania mangrovii]
MRGIGVPEDVTRLAPGTRGFVAALGIGQICSWGSLYYSFPQIAEGMGRELGWSRPDLYGAITLGLALSGLAAYPVGAAIDRGHGRAVMTGGSLLAGLLLIAWSQVETLWLFYAVFAGIGCLQAAVLYEPAFAVISRRMGAGRARAGITALTLWGGFASTVFIPLIEVLMGWWGWRGALVALGGVNIAICAGLYASMIDAGRDAPAPPPAAGAAAPLAGRRAVARAMRTPVFWALAVVFVAYTATFSAFTFHLYPLLLERGLDAAGAVTVMAVIGPAQVAGRFGIWIFGPRATVRSIGCVAVVVFAGAMIALAVLEPGLVSAAAIAALYGAANGVFTIVRGLAVPEMLTRDAYGAINGALLAPSLVAKAAAPLAVAYLWQASGTYGAVLAALVAGALILLTAFWAAAAFAIRAGKREQPPV